MQSDPPRPAPEAQRNICAEQQTAAGPALKGVQDGLRRGSSEEVASIKPQISTSGSNKLSEKNQKILTKEERLALAAAKKASLQKKQAGDTTKKASSDGKGQEAHKKVEDLQDTKRRFSEDTVDFDNVDEYDLALMGADLEDEGEAYVEGAGSRSSNSKGVQRGSMDDSAIVMMDTMHQPKKPMPMKGAVASPVAKGRFVDSSPTQVTTSSSSNQSIQRGQVIQKQPAPQKQMAAVSRQVYTDGVTHQIQHSDYKRAAPVQASKNIPMTKKVRPNE